MDIVKLRRRMSKTWPLTVLITEILFVIFAVNKEQPALNKQSVVPGGTER